MSIGLAGWRANGEELFLSDENSPADENPLKTSYVLRLLPYVRPLVTVHVVYAHVTPPLGNPMGCCGERPLLVAPFYTELQLTDV